jgi:general secretion pathway protein G
MARQNADIESSHSPHVMRRRFEFRISSFLRISDFGFRISAPRHIGPAGRHAFTLIELLLVVAILGILAAIVVPKFAGRTEDARKAAAVAQITVFKNALNTFEIDNGYYPKSLVDLIQQPRDAKKWRPYLDTDAIPGDPWGNPYVYTCPGKHNSYSFDIQSAGTDGQLGNDDDLGNWTMK